MLNYTKDLAEGFKKEARTVANQFLSDLLAVMTKKVELKLRQLTQGLEKYAEFEQALRLVEELTEKVENEQKILQEIYNKTSNLVQEIDVEPLSSTMGGRRE